VAGLAEIAEDHQLPHQRSIVTILTTGRGKAGTREVFQSHPQRSGKNPRGTAAIEKTIGVAFSRRETTHETMAESLFRNKIWLA
jgi:hypothetical protein